MKIAYLIRVRPDLEDLIPGDVEHVWTHVGDDGRYDDDTLARVADADAFVVGMEPVNEQILAVAPKVKIAQRLGVGYETIDLEATAKRGVYACNVEGVNKEAVAEHGMMFMLALAKQFLPAQQHTQDGDWAAARALTSSAFELKGRTLGIIGFGNTGTSLARRARAFEMDIVFNDVRNIDSDIVNALGARSVSKEELYQVADFVSINTDLNDSTRGMFGDEQIALMKDDARLICCARGGILDEQAVANALREGRLAAAGIDVFAIEPIAGDNPLKGISNCILTSHVAGVVSDSTARTWEWAHDNVRAVVLRGERPNWIRNGL
ncbi:MAG: phosphoglycerate dehydrogenase [Gammaproteobacteria bacterium]|nr:phosphoglycerate dehydrogenase [Gammaproteobacteria bacterium]